MKSLPRSLSFLFVLGLAIFAGTQRASAATPTSNQDSEQISKLLSEARGHAILAEDDAARLESYTRSRVSWKLHAHQLELMKNHVNEMGKIAADLQSLRAQGSTWQQQAIGEVMPLLKDLAGNLTTTIQHLNENQASIHMPAYYDYTRTNYELAKSTADLIKDYVEYDQARSKADSLEEKLEFAKN